MINTIDDIILQHSTRGMDLLQKKINKELCKIAVDDFLLLQKGVVFIYTGFYVNGIGETDGPIGAYFLSKALKKIGLIPVIITDKYCKDFFKDAVCLYIEIDSTKEYFLQLLEDYEPVAHFSIERCGQNSDKRYLNANKEDISTHTAPLDELFTLGSQSALTFAIGDGGNEIGMGNIENLIKEELNITSSNVKCDHLILASVSNWGAYGFIAYLDKWLKKDLLPTFSQVDTYLQHLLSLGALDGLTKENIKSVDGKDWLIEKEILESLKKINIY